MYLDVLLKCHVQTCKGIMRTPNWVAGAERIAVGCYGSKPWHPSVHTKLTPVQLRMYVHEVHAWKIWYFIGDLIHPIPSYIFCWNSRTHRGSSKFLGRLSPDMIRSLAISSNVLLVTACQNTDIDRNICCIIHDVPWCFTMLCTAVQWNSW